MKRTPFFILLVGTCLSSSLVSAADKTPDTPPESYPLKKCVVSDEPFGGDMGKPVKVTHNGTDVYLCCKACLKDFNKDPDKHTQKVIDAAKK